MGYNIVDVTPERVQVEYWLLDTVLKRSDQESLGAVWNVEAGEPQAIRV